MSKVFTDKEILDFVENNLELAKDDVGDVTLVNVSCDVGFVQGDVSYVSGDVGTVGGDVVSVYGDVGTVGGDVFSIT